MNTLLESLFDTYKVSPKDRYEIRQIYELLSAEKKVNLMNNFEALALKLEKISRDVEQEKEILVWSAITRIENVIELVKQKKQKKVVRSKIENLKQTL